MEVVVRKELEMVLPETIAVTRYAAKEAGELLFGIAAAAAAAAADDDDDDDDDDDVFQKIQDGVVG